jgi:hypothetical protein
MPKSFGGFGRIEDRPMHPASRENPETFGPLHAGSDESRAAQGEFLSAAGMKATVLLICGLSYGLKL